MPFLQVVIVIIMVGAFWGLVNSYIPMQGNEENAARARSPGAVAIKRFGIAPCPPEYPYWQVISAH
jgi:hypothetical protein